MSDSQLRTIEPQVTSRQCGGWLAVSPVEAPFRFGVVGSTEQEARDRFRQSLDKWVATISSDPRADTTAQAGVG
jgi:hypothetical protein